MLILRFLFPRKKFRKFSFIPIFLLFIFSFRLQYLYSFSSSSFLPVSYSFLSFFHFPFCYHFLLPPLFTIFFNLTSILKTYLFPIFNSFSSFHFLHIVLKSIIFSFFYTFLDMSGEMDREEGRG